MTRISRVKISGSPSRPGRPSRCKGLIECHLSSSPSVCSTDPRAGPGFLSGLSGSWDLRKMSVTQGRLATVCLMCAHKSWQRGSEVSAYNFCMLPRHTAHPQQREGEEVVANKSLHASNFENEVCLLWAFTSFLIHQTEKGFGKGKRGPHKTIRDNFKLRLGCLASWIRIVAWPVPMWPQGSCSTPLNLSVFFWEIMLKTCKGLAG